MADYVHGKMDIEQQKESFDSFWSGMVRSGVIIVIALALMYIFLT